MKSNSSSTGSASRRDELPDLAKLRPFGDAIRLDVTRAPFNADPTGRRDSTQSLVQALDAITQVTAEAFEQVVRELEALPGDGHLPSGVENRKENGRIKGIFPAYLPYLPVLYLPAGVYRVTDTVCYTLETLKNSMGSELNRQIRLVGDGPDKSVIQLEAHAPAFAGDEPRPVVGLMRGGGSNVSMSNYVESLSIDVGRGNPAAVGLDFFANNTGAVRDVVIRSADGRGKAGLHFGHRGGSGMLIERVTIEGFETGMLVTSGYLAAEHITLRGQSRACVGGSGGFYLSMRKIQTEAEAPAFVCDSPQSLAAIVDSTFKGSGPYAVDNPAGALYMANVEVRGFDAVLRSTPEEATPSIETLADGVRVHEVALPRSFSFDASATPMPRLPVEEPPDFKPLGPGETRCGVRQFGAVGDGRHDDSPAIQAALNSGAAEVSFEPGHYMLDNPVTVPSGIRRIAFNYVDLVAGDALGEMAGPGSFVMTEDSDEPLHLEKLFAWELWRGKHHTFHQACRRTVVIRDMHTQTSPLYENSVPGSRVFLDNTCCTTGVIPGATGHSRPCFAFRGQKVWARQFDPERGEPMALNDGGDLWVLGYKTEDCGVAFHTLNGGRTEIIGGMLFSGRPHTTAILTIDSQTRITGCTSGGVPNGYYGTAICEEQAGEVQTLPASAMPLRGCEPKCGPQYHIPLFTSACR